MRYSLFLSDDNIHSRALFAGILYSASSCFYNSFAFTSKRFTISDPEKAITALTSTMNMESQLGADSRTAIDFSGNGAGNSTTLQHSGESPTLNDNNGGFDIAGEIKRWQQLHQTNLSAAPTALLSTSSNNLQHDASTAAFLQQVLESQQQRGAPNRFEIPLANYAALSGGNFGQILGSGTNDSSNGNVELFSNDNSNSNGTLNHLQQNNFFSDARLLMAQQAVAAMNFPNFSNQLIFQQQQQQPAQAPQQEEILEPPLPSPHSLFHRDGSRRMRGGVIEPFPVRIMILLQIVFFNFVSLLTKQDFLSVDFCRKNFIAYFWK
jgi:hypothetical protein